MKKIKFTIDLHDFTEDEVKQISEGIGLEMPTNKVDYEINGQFEDTNENWEWFRRFVISSPLPIKIDVE